MSAFEEIEIPKASGGLTLPGLVLCALVLSPASLHAAGDGADPDKEAVEQKQPAKKPPKVHPLVGQAAPKWEVDEWHQLPDGVESLDVSDFRGKVLFMYSFQSWCPACHKRGFPALKKLSEQYKDDDGVAFVAFQTVFEDRKEGEPVNTFENLKKLAAKHELSIPFAQSGSKGDRSKILTAYKAGGTPWAVIIDKQGVIRYASFFIPPDEASKLIESLKAADGDH